MTGITDHIPSDLKYVQGRNFKLLYVDVNIYMTTTVLLHMITFLEGKGLEQLR